MQRPKVQWELSKRLLNLQYSPLTAKEVFEDSGGLGPGVMGLERGTGPDQNDGDHLYAKKSLHFSWLQIGNQF